MKKVKLDIGCGQNLTKGFEGVDIHPGKNIKYVGDIFDFWTDKSVWKQIPDNSVDEIVGNMIVEHIPHIIEGHGMKWGYDDCFYLFFDEIYRILKKAKFDPENPNIPLNGKATFVTPYYSSMRAWQDPTHYRAISEASYLYLDKKWREDNKLDHYPVKCDFGVMFAHNIDGSLQNRNREYVMEAMRTQINAVPDLSATIYKR